MYHAAVETALARQVRQAEASGVRYTTAELSEMSVTISKELKCSQLQWLRVLDQRLHEPTKRQDPTRGNQARSDWPLSAKFSRLVKQYTSSWHAQFISFAITRASIRRPPCCSYIVTLCLANRVCVELVGCGKPARQSASTFFDTHFAGCSRHKQVRAWLLPVSPCTYLLIMDSRSMQRDSRCSSRLLTA